MLIVVLALLAQDASGLGLYPPSQLDPQKPIGHVHTVQLASRTPPFRQTSVHTEHVGPDRPGWHRHEQFLSVVDPAAQMDCAQPAGGAGLATTSPAVDSIPHVSLPRRIRKKPSSPHPAPHEFWQIQ